MKYILLSLSLWMTPGMVLEAQGAKARVPSESQISMIWKTDSGTSHWLFQKDGAFSGPAPLANLAQVKKLELEEKYEACAQQILQIWSQYPEFKGWMALQGTQCLVSQLKFSKPKNKNLYSHWWDHLMKQGEWMLFGPWTEELLRNWASFAQVLFKNTGLSLSFRGQVADSWRRFQTDINRNDRMELYQILVEELQKNGDTALALAVSQREGLVKDPEAPNSGNGAGNGASNGNGNGSKSTEKNAKTEKVPTEEDQLHSKFLEALKQNQWVAGSEIGVKILDRFPSGVRAASVFERLQQVYFNLWESSGNANSTTNSNSKKILEDLLDVAQGLHSSRLMEWARAAHRRNDFGGAYYLAKKALPGEEKSPDGASLLYIAGRSAYLQGRYREAVEFFDRLNERHFGYSEIWEARFRRALAFIRLGEEEKAEEALGELAMAPENKSYGLASLYWLIRLKQKRNADIAEWVQQMQDKFPLTYYGLRLNAEANQQKVVLPKEVNPPLIQQSWVLTHREKQQWERVQDLAKAGWYVAAQGEFTNLVLSGGPEKKFLWVQQLTKVFAYPQAIKLMNELMDQEPRWRKLNYLRGVFPKPLEHIVEKEAAKNALHPNLVFSLMRQESAFNLGATSRSQAKGLMQLIPPTAMEVAQDLRIKNFDPDQMYHPVVNVKFGSYYLAKVIRQFGGNVSVGLAAYNAGPQRLKRFFSARPEVENPSQLSQQDPWSELWIEELPWLETNLYVKSILRNRVMYQVLEQGSFVWPSPLWKDLFNGAQMELRDNSKEGEKQVSKAGMESEPMRKQ